MVLIGLVLALPGTARASIDDDWALINSCAKLRAFQAKHGTRNRYASHVTTRARQLGCRTPSPPTPPTPPPPPQLFGGSRDRDRKRPVDRSGTGSQANAKQDYVMLAPSGGDASDLTTALRMVKPGGLISVQPGRYVVTGQIGEGVRIEGIAGRWRDTVLTGSLTVAATATDVRFANLTFQASVANNFLSVFGKFSCDSCDLRSELAQTASTIAGIPIYVGGRGEIHLLNSRGTCSVETCFALSFNAPGGNRSTIVSSILDHEWAGIYHHRGDLYIWNSQFDGMRGGAIFRPASGGTLEIAHSRVRSLDNSRYYTVQVEAAAGFTLRRNAFTANRPQNLLDVAGTVYRDITLFPGGNFIGR
jgi:hypothetical protein